MDLFVNASPWEFLFLATGLALLVAGSGLAEGLSIAGVELPAPKLSRVGHTLLFLAGLVLLIAGYYLSKTSWKAVIRTELVYSARESLAKQIVMDGHVPYLLLDSGNVLRLGDKLLPFLPRRTALVDPGTETQAIAAAGGVIYVLKDRGHVWMGYLTGAPTYRQIDSGTNTRMMALAGESLYVVKESGLLWRISLTDHAQLDPPPSSECAEWNSAGGWTYCRLSGVDEEVDQVAFSGTVLYYLTRAGRVRAYLPQRAARETGSEKPGRFTILERINGQLAGCGAARQIAVDGSTLYLIGAGGDAFLCERGKRERIFRAHGVELVKQVEARAGYAYLLTRTDAIYRYDAATGHVARYKPGSHVDSVPLRGITAAGHSCFAVSQDGRVWRYSESLQGR